MNTPRKSQLPEHEPNTGAQQIADTDILKNLDAEQMCISILEAALKQICQLKQRSADLLVDAKKICLNQMNSMQTLREENTRLEQTNIRLEGKLQQAVAQLEEHRVQSQQLTDKLSRGADQLDRKQAELENMTERYNALQSDFRAMQLENDVKINELQGCLALADHPEPENIPQQFIKELEAKIALFEHTFALLRKHADQIQAELNSMGPLLQINQTCSGPQGCSTPLCIVECLGDIISNPIQMNTDKIIKLQNLLEERDRNLHLLQEKKTRLDSCILCMQKELGELQQNGKYYSRLRERLMAIIAERDALIEHRQESDNHLKKMQVEELRQRHDNENLKQECDQLMEDNLNLAAKGDAAMELHREAKTEMYRLSRHCEVLINELSKLRDVARELEEQREQHTNLERSMQIVKTNAEQLAKKLKTEKDSHRKELQDLEEQIGREKGEKAPAANCSKCLNGKLNDIRNAEIQIMELQRVSGSTELPSTSTGITHEHTEQIERRCGDQMMNSSSHMGKAEDKYQCLLRSYFGVRDELEQRLNEVDCLKKTIMEERAKTANILNAQKSELIKKLGKCCENERLVLELKHGIEKTFS
ncbi:myosin heavy chain, embryonic smooth muscle isoform-like [Drosophila miranda]|uniref:myosin heavy chain, embryonic smooth muscle isoform-like n=1 Tax=Drosophila miranda TaxID=7229 RepID=UPI00143F9246|nr:myosin heavy chain, embryonic smooth muscle isoform-like [Drosophila miranda]